MNRAIIVILVLAFIATGCPQKDTAGGEGTPTDPGTSASGGILFEDLLAAGQVLRVEVDDNIVMRRGMVQGLAHDCLDLVVVVTHLLHQYLSGDFQRELGDLFLVAGQEPFVELFQFGDNAVERLTYESQLLSLGAPLLGQVRFRGPVCHA